MATPQSLKQRHQDILDQYAIHHQATIHLQREVLDRLLPDLTAQLDDIDPEVVQEVNTFAKDTSTIFRFLRRARFNPTTATALLTATVHFRLSLPPPSANPLASNPYSSAPTFFFHPALRDRFGRPAGVLNLRDVRRAPDGSLDALKEFVRGRWEEGRRVLEERSRDGSEGEGEVCLQMVVIVDLEGAGMANLEVELLPYFMALLKNHFPGMVGAVFVLNYGWSFAGMWALARRVLPQTALDRILFPTKAELLQFFGEDHLLREHGGTVEYKYQPPTADPLTTPQDPNFAYPSPTASTPTSPRFPFPIKPLHPINTHLANTPRDDDFLSHDGQDVFHSARQTPHPSAPTTPLAGPSTSATASATHLRRAHGLGMTALSGSGSAPLSHAPSARHSPTATWAFPSWSRGGHGHGHGHHGAGTSTPGGGAGLRRVSSLAELQARLEEAQAEIGESESETGSSVGTETEEKRTVEGSVVDAEEEGGDGEEQRAGASAGTSRASSRVVSRLPSQDHSRQVSPTRIPGGSRISPYHSANPYWGYPAYLPPPSSSSSTHPYGSHAPIPQPHHHRRRKRDLARTLSYLAALRFLALHRALQRRARELVASALYAASLRWLWQRRQAPRSPELRRVHWAEGVVGRGEAEQKWKWKRMLGWVVVMLVVLARRPRLRARLAELSRRASRLGVEVAVGRVDGRRARAMAQGADLARWAGTKIISQ